ncbi:MAG: glycosyltransferase [Sulfitobacter sp.]|nr:glycosyltransferase [Sulfitobacter sp.]
MGDKILLIGGAAIAAGVPRHICQLARALEPLAEVEVISEADQGGFATLPKGVRHHILPHLSTCLAPGHLWQATKALLTVLRKSDANLVWLHARLPLLLARLLLVMRLWRPNARVACSIHGLPFDPGHRAIIRFLSLFLERLLLTFAPTMHLVFLNDEMAERFCDAVGHRAAGRHRVHVLENCADLGPLPVRTTVRGRQLVMTGRRSYQKNLHRAALLLAQMPADTHLTYCGPGTSDPDFCDEIAAIVPPEVFTRIGFVGPVRDVRPILAEADAYLLTSRYEGVPLGLLEAFEAGLPTILSDFVDAVELAQAQPFALSLKLENLERDAARVTELLNRYSTDRVAARHEIRSLWSNRWSRAQFDPAARALAWEMLGHPQITALAAE